LPCAAAAPPELTNGGRKYVTDPGNASLLIGATREPTMDSQDLNEHDIHEHHEQAALHHEHAAKHHREAAKHHKAGDHEKAAHHSKVAQGHHLYATEHHEEAAKLHTDEHGE
jgi:hypothetical protein